MKIKNLAVATWTHSSYSDIWPMYYEQFNDCAPFLKHYLMIDELSDSPSLANVKQIKNNKEEVFSKRLCESIKQIPEDNIIYMQEDFILYDKVDRKDIEDLNDFLNNSNYSFIRLMKSGVEGGPCVNNDLSLFEVPRSCQYIFSLQATIWKKKDLLNLLSTYNPASMLDSELYGSYACRSLDIEGCYVYNNEPKRGNLHYDSNVFPYISTALHGGSYGKSSKWQVFMYPEIFDVLFKKYNIDPSIRGVI